MRKYVPLQYEKYINIFYISQLIEAIGKYENVEGKPYKKGINAIIRTCNTKFKIIITKTEVKKLVDHRKSLFNGNFKVKIPMNIEYILKSIHELVNSNKDLKKSCIEITNTNKQSNKCMERLYYLQIMEITAQEDHEIREVLNPQEYSFFKNVVNSIRLSNIICN